MNNTKSTITPVQYPGTSTTAAATRLRSFTGAIISSTENDTNPILMEAKLLELITSIKQLISSNTHLETALNDEGHDEELLQALIENDNLIIKQINMAQNLSMKIQQNNGVEITLGDKIPEYNGSALLKKMEEKKQGSGDGGSGEMSDTGGGGMYL